MMSFRKIIIFRLFFLHFLNLNCILCHFLKLSTIAGAVVAAKVSYYFEVESEVNTYLRQIKVFKVHRLPQD